MTAYRYYINLFIIAWNKVIQRWFASASDQVVIAILTVILAGFLSTIDTTPLLSKDQWNYFAPVVAGLMVFIATYLLDLLKTPHLLAAEGATTIARLQNELRETVAPKFEIIFGQTAPYWERYYETYQGKLFRRVVRVGLHNSSLITIEDASVSLSHVEPSCPGATTLPVILHQMHDNPFQKQKDLAASGRYKVLTENSAPYKLKFDLNPGDTRLIDVVSRLEYKEESPIDVCTALSYMNCVLPAGRQILTIRATGRNVPAVEKRFIVSWDREQFLIFEPLN